MPIAISENFLFTSMFFTFAALTGAIAGYKGYNPLIWFCAGTCIGFLAVLTLQPVDAEGLHPVEQRQRQKRGNLMGINLIWIMALFVMHKRGLCYLSSLMQR